MQRKAVYDACIGSAWHYLGAICFAGQAGPKRCYTGAASIQGVLRQHVPDDAGDCTAAPSCRLYKQGIETSGSIEGPAGRDSLDLVRRKHPYERPEDNPDNQKLQELIQVGDCCGPDDAGNCTAAFSCRLYKHLVVSSCQLPCCRKGQSGKPPSTHW